MAQNIQFCDDLFCVYVFFRDWQTLIAGLLAVFAAYKALQPVYEQLDLNRTQLAIARREVLVDREEQIARRRQDSATRLQNVTWEFRRQIFFGGADLEEKTAEINPHWAHSAEQECYSVRSWLAQQHGEQADAAEIDAKRTALIKALVALCECLEIIHRPHSSNFLDDVELTPEQAVAQETKASANAEAAKADLPACIRGAETAAGELDTAYEEYLNKLRERIQQINETVLRAEA